MTNWEPVIGLEIHAQLLTKSKLFSGASTTYGAPPNTQASLVDLGYPGVLPVLNEKALEFAIRFGLAIGAQIEKKCVFARKNYFYPDLPKGYQISQFDQPIVSSGTIEVPREDGSTFFIEIERAHLEEDAGKSIHDRFDQYTAIDLNRSGTPLLEIVSKPQLFSIADAVQYAKWIHTLCQYLEICDGNMQEGSFRCDANVSIKPVGSTTLGTRTEIKNLNSFRYLSKAISYEIERQTDCLEQGESITQETRLYNVASGETRPMRSKENANDYRYFSDPDLLPTKVSQELIALVKTHMPELPDAKKTRFISQYHISEYDANLLTADKTLADYFEHTCAQLEPDMYSVACSWVSSNLLGLLNKQQLTIHQTPISAKNLAALIELINQKVISGKIAKEVFLQMAESGETPSSIVKEKGFTQITDESEIQAILENILTQNPKQLEQYKQGKDKLFGFFVGQAMKATSGQANPELVNKLLKKLLS